MRCRNTLKRVLLACIPVVCAQVGVAQVTTTVQPGAWFDPATWSNGVPTAADDAIIIHSPIEIFDLEMAEAKSLTVGLGGAGLLTMDDDSFLTLVGDLLVGSNGGAGTVDFDGSAFISCDNVLVGNNAPGTILIGTFSTIDCSALVVGTTSPGTVFSQSFATVIASEQVVIGGEADGFFSADAFTEIVTPTLTVGNNAPGELLMNAFSAFVVDDGQAVR